VGIGVVEVVLTTVLVRFRRRQREVVAACV